ncbi:Gtpase-activating protein gyp5, partial [Globisporangium splendens]
MQHETLMAPQEEQLQRKYARANALVASVLNKYYNGSARAVDPFVIRCLQEEETKLFSIQCFIEEGPTETRREWKDASATTATTKAPSFSCKSFNEPCICFCDSQMLHLPIVWFVSLVLSRLFTVCGGYLGGPGSIMRHWEELSDAGYDDAMREYIAVVDKIVPGWDDGSDNAGLEYYPVAKQEKFWQDDAAVGQCQYCGAHFSLQRRRHHCRMCFDIFCADCCNNELEIALCPGAPVRLQRVCCQCFQESERDKSLREVRRVIRENHDMEQQLKTIQATTDALIAVKQREERKLREDARENGCDMDALEAAIQKRTGATTINCSSIASSSSTKPSRSFSPPPVAIKTPPAHKFAPRETVEANEQLALAHRQLLMGLKVAQCRAKKALETMDSTISMLRQAICFGASNWTIVLRATRRFLTLQDVKTLLRVSKALHAGVARAQCEKKCILEQDLSTSLRPKVWQAECMKHDKTRAYITDLADAIRTRFDDTSDSETDDSDSNEGSPSSRPETRDPLWLSLVQTMSSSSSILTDPTERATETVWTKAYATIVSRCKASSPAGDDGIDAQIRRDAQRTFGVSALRTKANKMKTYQRTPLSGSSIAVANPAEVAVEVRRNMLVNVLHAFASVNTEVGYCQGMDHVTAVLLSIVDWDESKAFWLLTSLVACPKYELAALYSPGLSHLPLRCFQLEKIVATYLPELSSHLVELEFPVSVFATSWFMTLFTSLETLSYDVTLRVLDGFVVAGWKQIFRVALVILESLQHNILASAFEEISQIFYDVQAHAVTNGLLQTLQYEYEASSPSSSPSSITLRIPAGAQRRKARHHDSTSKPNGPGPSQLSTNNGHVAKSSRARQPSLKVSTGRSNGAPTPIPAKIDSSLVMTTKKSHLAVHEEGQKSPDATRDAAPLVSPPASATVRCEMAVTMSSEVTNYHF